MRKRRLSIESLESRNLLTAVAGAADIHLDVNDDGAVTPLDALLILNVVNESSQSLSALRLEATATAERHAAYDLNLDGTVGPVDALMVINGLDRSSFEVSDVPTVSEEPRGRALHAALAGDFDGNCEVDQQDYDMWASTFGSTTELAADGNNDGVVDAADFTIWREQRGTRRCSVSDTVYWSLTNVEFDDRSLHANADGSVDLVPSTEDDIVWLVELDAVTDTVTLKDVESDAYLGAQGFRVFMTANVDDNARWSIIHNDDGSVLFRNVATGRYFDGDGAAEGWSVQESLATDADTRWKPNVWVLPSSSSVSLAHIADYGAGTVSTLRVASRVNLAQPDLVLGGGDARYPRTTFDTANGLYCDYQSNVAVGPNCASGGNSVPNRFFSVPGNHDYTDSTGIEGYHEYFNMPGRGATQTLDSGSELYYDVVLGPIHLFALDSEAMRFIDGSYTAQVDWLEEALAASTAPWQVVMIHHAPFASSPTHGSNVIMQLPYANWGVDLVLGGHIHVYERLERDGTTFVVNGLGGVSQYPLGQTPLEGSVVQYNAGHGASFIEATATTLEGRFVDLNGDIVDTFSVSPAVGGQPDPENDLRFLGRTFFDDNENGLRETDESLLPGVIVYLDVNRNNQRDDDERFVTSDEMGFYEFDFEVPRAHRFNFEAPDGLTSTLPSYKKLVDIAGPEPLVVDVGFRPVDEG